MKTAHLEAAVEWLGQADFVESMMGSIGPAARLVSVVMSHRGRARELDADFRAGLERLFEKLRRDRMTLLASDETPMGGYLLNAAGRFDIPVVRLVSPPNSRADEEGLPWIDRALIAMPDKVYAVEVRPESKTVKLLLRRLKDHRFPEASVYVEVSPSPVGGEPLPNASPTSLQSLAADRLLEHGSVAHLYTQVPWDDSEVVDRSNGPARNLKRSVPFESFGHSVVPILQRLTDFEKLGREWPYLTHCTRACLGPWPDQSVEGYFDDLLVGSTRSQVGTPLATLSRILTQQRLIATKHLKRSDHMSVSFSQVPLLELLSRRTFRSHLGRWDWEPYGICIRRNSLESLGARPVLYRSLDEWAKLPEEDRPYFQIRDEPEKSTVGPRWEEEREWRIVEDLHLARIPFEAGFVFVPTMDEALELSRLSRFPILCLDRLVVS